ncbi:M6 family metalloprotease domain-containing protein [Zavarzinella formosa]|uniref:M6 family metalloprotease domain-containing protein n=1 Tax=Zavarzinella formosa TaxID=360055 RepID=UPI0002FB7B31|nr:M6 family metalloprotease domain-containing protein [Zavarzinella formosa]
MRIFVYTLLILMAASLSGFSQQSSEDFKTPATARTTTVKRGSTTAVNQPGFLGVHVETASPNQLVVRDIQPASPGQKAGLLVGDIITKLDDRSDLTPELFRSLLHSREPDETVKITVKRPDGLKELTAKLGGTSKPMKLGAARIILGVRLADRDDGMGATIDQITPASPASKAGLKEGDILLKVDGNGITMQSRLADLLAEHKAGDEVKLLFNRNGREVEAKATLAAEETRVERKGQNWDDRLAGYWKKDTYRIAIIGIDFQDVKHNPKVTAKDWEDSLFTKGTFTQTNATGQKVYGSLNDYYREQSFGKLKVEGKVFEWVVMPKNRMDYGQGTNANTKTELLKETLDKLVARDGKDTLKNFDGVFFLYAGDGATRNRGNIYWPHRANITYDGKRLPYFIMQAGATKMSNISTMCHEFGHMLGLPDLYARPENPGSEGVGIWCAMSNQIGNGRPQHFSAWCKEQLEWIKPAVIDPTVRQKLILGPIEDSPTECFKILVRPDGSEYFLLENRRRKGFDSDLAAEGLLIWRVVQNKPILEEAHGVEGPAGPRVFLNSVPFPSPANQSFTPYTTPSSRSMLGGGLPVHLTNITKRPDGKITFLIGYEFN